MSMTNDQLKQFRDSLPENDEIRIIIQELIRARAIVSEAQSVILQVRSGASHIYRLMYGEE